MTLNATPGDRQLAATARAVAGARASSSRAKPLMSARRTDNTGRDRARSAVMLSDTAVAGSVRPRTPRFRQRWGNVIATAPS